MLKNATINRVWLLMLSVCFLPGLLKAQLAAQYGYSTLTGTYADMVGGTSVNGILADDATSTGIPIGFSFTFCGTSYTNVSVCSNGFLSLSGTTSTFFSNTQSNISGTGFLMPYWDDGYGITTGASAKYITTGTAPNRVFTFEWKNWGYCCASTVYQSYQVKLYETTNVIEFWYQPIASNSTRSATIGIANSTTDWQVLNGVSSSAVSSSTVFTTTIPNQPDSGRIFRYTPPAPCTGAPTITSISPATPVAGACLGSTVTFAATLPPALNVSYQWLTATSCAGPWNVVAGATNITYTTPLITGPAYYQLIATCTTSNLATTSPCQSIIPPGLFPAGTYTINSTLPTSGSNFNSLTDAVNAIKCGIAGPVVFNAVPGTGPYNEQISIPSIYNSSAINTVTFNGNHDTISYVNNIGTNYAVVTLNDADYITFKKWVIAPSVAGTYGFGLQLTNNADKNIIDSNIITLPITTSSSNFCGLVITGSTTSYYATGSYCDSNRISNNTIIGGYYGLTMYGASTTDRVVRNVVSGNKLKDFYYMGMYLFYTDNTTIEKNDISRPTRTNHDYFYGIYSYYGGNGLKVSKNRVHDPFGADTTTTYSAYGIMTYYSLGTPTVPIEISNNAIYNFKSNGYQVGIYDYNNVYTTDAYNTISLDHQAAQTSTTYGLYVYMGTSTIKNNIFSITRGGTGSRYALYRSSGTLINDYNDYYKNSSATNYTGYYGGAVATFAAWQTSTGGEANSKTLNPYFTNAALGDLMPSNDSLNDMGTPITGITTDILNTTRKPLTPDMGAWEFAHKCDGPGYAGIAVASDTGMCPGYMISLTDTTYQKDVSFLTRIWQQSSNNGSTWYDIANSANKDSLQLIFPQTTMQYRVKMTCLQTGDTSYSNAATIILKPSYKCYCVSQATGGAASDSSDIGAFSIGNFSTNTGGPHIMNPVSVKGRTDYTDYGPIVLYKDSTYAVSVYHAMKSVNYANALVTMFMDFNNNLVYDYNTNESVSLNTPGNNANSWTSSDPNAWYIINHVTIPHAVITNVPTGLRLVLNSNTTATIGANPQSVTGCGPYISGETEDYVVIFKERFITGVNSIAGVDEFVVYPNPNNGLFSVSFKAQQRLSNVQVVVTDITGRIIQNVDYGDVSGGSFLKNIDLSQQAKGVYLVELKANNQKIFEKVMVK